MTQASIDPIRLEILWNGLRSVSDEMFSALMRSAYSTNIKERHDHSTAVIDAEGRLIAQAHKSLPIHLGSMMGMVEAVLAKYNVAVMAPGDIYAANDPYAAGGTHLPDIALAMPIFDGTQLLGFACNLAHHADVGGMSAGSSSTHAREIYQEGLRIPPVRLFTGGKIERDILDLMLINMRLPSERQGDLNAQIAACRLGERRLREMLAVNGGDTIETVFKEIIERTKSRFEAAVETIPDGVYTFTDYMDDHGYSDSRIQITATITVEGRSILIDFEGTSAAVEGGINIPLGSTQAAVCYALKALLDPEIPNNDGILQVCRVKAPEGSLVNPVFPFPVVGRANTSQRVIDAVFGALVEALPEQSVGAANGAVTAAVYTGTDPRTNKPYVYLETIGGGFGGRSDADGKDGVQCHTTNTSNLPTEAVEMEYPLLVERYELVDGSGGAGTFRGGLGMRRVIRPVGHTCRFFGQGERQHTKPWGILGGLEAQSAHFALRHDDETIETLGPDPDDIQVTPETVIEVVTAGGGGYGDPKDRDPALIARDIAQGKISPEEAVRVYGCASTKEAALQDA